MKSRVRRCWSGALVALAFGLLLVAPRARADSACVSTPAQLQNALLQWLLLDSGTMTIKIEKGVYALAPNNHHYSEAHEVNLNLLGGYRPGTNCTQRDVDPTNTVLDGGNSGAVIFWIGAFSDVTIEGLTFAHLRYGFALFHHEVQGRTGSDHAFSVRYNIFRNFQVVTDAQAPLNIDAGVYINGDADDDTGATVSFKNNLVYDLQMAGPEPAVNLESAYDGSVTAAYNTITANSAPSVFGMYLPLLGAPRVVNNILWNGAAPALDTTEISRVPPAASYNILGPVSGILSGDVANLDADPKFTAPASANYTLAPNSPAVNSGGSAVLVNGGYTSHDLDGGPRVTGSAIDRGAYESPYDDAVDFTVTSAVDATQATNPNVSCNAGSSTCTLREAILRADAAAGSSTIRFNLPCPTLMSLTAPLPNLTGATLIDGYSNPGAAQNTSDTAFNAVLCVFLNGNGAVARALRTSGSGKLTVRGLGFAGFTTEAVLLDAGSGHSIAGNQFGAIAFTSGNQTGVRIQGNAGQVFVGGYDSDAVRNLISGSNGAGVVVTSTNGGSTVANNFIGLLPNGTTAAPNAGGVVISNSPDNVVAYNTIAASEQYGIELTGISTQRSIVNYNVLGYSPDMQTQLPGGWSGIAVTFGASNNVIGAPANGTAGGNAVLNTTGAGIWVSSGSGNRVLGNGPVRGGATAPAIDLDTFGATTNDANDSDGGANDLQNFPVVAHLFRTAAAEWIEWTLDSTPGDAFRLDFYRDVCCAQGPGNPPRGNVGIYLLRAGSGVTDANGHAHGWLRLNKFTTLLTWTVAATATSAGGDTSELGPYATESHDMLFRDDFELY